MVEYSGPLMGGPDDGNIVTTSTDKIPVKNTCEMWLDGETKDATLIEQSGYYMWDVTGNFFMWNSLESKAFSKKIVES